MEAFLRLLLLDLSAQFSTASIDQNILLYQLHDFGIEPKNLVKNQQRSHLSLNFSMTPPSKKINR